MKVILIFKIKQKCDLEDQDQIIKIMWSWKSRSYPSLSVPCMKMQGATALPCLPLPTPMILHKSKNNIKSKCLN